jgi:hypothetical protein
MTISTIGKKSILQLLKTPPSQIQIQGIKIPLERILTILYFNAILMARYLSSIVEITPEEEHRFAAERVGSPTLFANSRVRKESPIEQLSLKKTPSLEEITTSETDLSLLDGTTELQRSFTSTSEKEKSSSENPPIIPTKVKRIKRQRPYKKIFIKGFEEHVNRIRRAIKQALAKP